MVVRLFRGEIRLMKLRQRLVAVVLTTLVCSTLAYAAPARAILPLSKIVPGRRRLGSRCLRAPRSILFTCRFWG